MAYGTMYLGGKPKAYLVRMRMAFPEWMTIAEVKDKLEAMVENLNRDDETFYFDDWNTLSEILEIISYEDTYIYWSFVCDKTTYKKLWKLRKYYGIELEKTGGRWV